MSFLDTDKHPFTLILSPKFQDTKFLNSFEIDNIEKYLEIREEDIQELENLCEIGLEEDGKTYLRLPLDDSIQFKEITQKLHDSVQFLSRIVSPKKKTKRLGRSYLDDKTNRTRHIESSNPMNLDEAVEDGAGSDRDEVQVMGEETQMFADFERILKDFEISAVKHDNDNNKLMLILEDCKKTPQEPRELDSKSASGMNFSKDENKFIQLSPLRPKGKAFLESPKNTDRELKINTERDELIIIQENFGIEAEVKTQQPVQEQVDDVTNKENKENIVVFESFTPSDERKDEEKKGKGKGKSKKAAKIYIKGNNGKGCHIF